jgi:hypothetical protein
MVIRFLKSGYFGVVLSSVLLTLFVLIETLSPYLHESVVSTIRTIPPIERIVIATLGFIISTQQIVITRLEGLDHNKTNINTILETVSSYVPRIQDENSLKNIHYKGLHSIHSNLSLEYVKKQMANSGNIQILQTYSPSLEHLLPDLVLALKRGATIRILLLHPKSDANDYRTRAIQEEMNDDESSSEKNVREAVKNNLRDLARIYKEVDEASKKRLNVGLYDSLPSITLHSMDDVYLIGFYLHGRLAVETPQLEFFSRSKERLLVDTFQGEFDRVWKIAAKIRLNRWENDLEAPLNTLR